MATIQEADSIALAVHTGREGAVERLVRAYQDQLYGFALRMLRNPYDAQEVTQDAFVRAYRALTQRYDEQQCRNLVLRPWLFRITRNLAHNRHRARKAIRESPLESCGEEPAYAGLQSDQGMELEQALMRLQPAAREMVVLRFVEGLSYAELAEVSGTTEASARAKVFRALQFLKKSGERPRNPRPD